MEDFMKKFMWIPALLTVLVLMVTGCPGTGDAVETPTGGDQAAANWYLSATEGGAAVANNTITVAAVTNVYIYFDPLGKDFDTIAFDFTATPGVNLTVTAIYGMFDGSTCTWGKQDWDTNWYESGPLTIDTTAFTADWSGTGAGSIDKTTVKGFCINIAATAETTFTLNGVTFAGTGSGTGGGAVDILRKFRAFSMVSPDKTVAKRELYRVSGSGSASSPIISSTKPRSFASSAWSHVSLFIRLKSSPSGIFVFMR